jgi:hypothetical protein
VNALLKLLHIQVKLAAQGRHALSNFTGAFIGIHVGTCTKL